MKHHPGDWVFVIAGGRMVAMTPEAFGEAWAMAREQHPEAWEMLRAKNLVTGDMLVIILDVMVRDGLVRIEERSVAGADRMSWPVYAMVPAEPRERPELRVVESSEA